jgi:hypothetical protein
MGDSRNSTDSHETSDRLCHGAGERCMPDSKGATRRPGASILLEELLRRGPHNRMRAVNDGAVQRRAVLKIIRDGPQCVSRAEEKFLCPSLSPGKRPFFRPVAKLKHHGRGRKRRAGVSALPEIRGLHILKLYRSSSPRRAERRVPIESSPEIRLGRFGCGYFRKTDNRRKFRYLN